MLNIVLKYYINVIYYLRLEINLNRRSLLLFQTRVIINTRYNILPGVERIVGIPIEL